MRKFGRFVTERVELHDALNPKLWDGDELRPLVRERLLLIASAWAQFAKIPWSLVADVVMTGGNANYNYTAHSDIDVHLMLSRAALGFGVITDDYLKDKKKLWTYAHAPTIGGYPVELYAQDKSEASPTSQGVYSLARATWIVHPALVDPSSIDQAAADAKTEHLRALIDDAISTGSLDAAIAAKKSIAQARKVGIAAGGEFAPENLAFKELRNSGDLDRLSSFITRVYDASLSVE